MGDTRCLYQTFWRLWEGLQIVTMSKIWRLCFSPTLGRLAITRDLNMASIVLYFQYEPINFFHRIWGRNSRSAGFRSHLKLVATLSGRSVPRWHAIKPIVILPYLCEAIAVHIEFQLRLTYVTVWVAGIPLSIHLYRCPVGWPFHTENRNKW